MKSYKNYTETLKGNQHKLDKNKNGKVDAHDFKLLRKEEQIDELSKSTLGAYVKKSSRERGFSGLEAGASGVGSHDQKNAVKTMKKRQAGVIKAVDRLTKEAVQKVDIPAYLRKAKGDTPLKMSDLKRKDTISDKENLAKLRGVKEEVELDESVFADKEQAQSVAAKLKSKHEDGNYSVVADKGKHRVVHAYHSDSRVKKDIAKLNEEQIDEAAYGKDKMANMRDAHNRHMEKALAANKAGDDTAVKVHQSKMSMLKNKMDKLKQNEEVDLELSDLEGLDEAKPGLYANINAKRKRIEAGSGEKMRKVGSKGAPSASDFKDAAKTANEEVEMCDECDMPEAECECDHEKEEMKEGKHVVGVTISDPNHTMVSQRNEKKMRKAKVSAPDKDTAINNALAYYKKRGYKVHDSNYIGLHNEETIQELSKDTLDSYRQKAFADQPSTRSDNPAKYDKRKAGRSMAFDKVLGRKPVKEGLAGKVTVGGKTLEPKKAIGSDIMVNTPADKPVSPSSPIQPAGSALERIRASMRKEANEPPFDGPYTTSKPAKKNSDGTTQSPMSRARELAKQSIPKKMKEDLDEARVNGREYASQGVMHPDHAKMDIHKVSGQHVDFYGDKTGDKMQGKVIKNDGKSVHIQAHKELGDGKLHKFKVTPNLPKKIDEKMDMAKADMGDVIKDFKKSDAPQFLGKNDEKRRQMAIAAKLQATKAQKEERELKNFKQFVEDIYQNLPQIEEEIDNIDEDVEQLDEYESGKDGVYRHTKKATYGTSYQGDDDEDEKPKPAAGEKRGRGRPAGSSSGARQKGTTAKKRSGVEYTGMKLHLPNNNR